MSVRSRFAFWSWLNQSSLWQFFFDWSSQSGYSDLIWCLCSFPHLHTFSSFIPRFHQVHAFRSGAAQAGQDIRSSLYSRSPPFHFWLFPEQLPLEPFRWNSPFSLSQFLHSAPGFLFHDLPVLPSWLCGKGPGMSSLLFHLLFPFVSSYSIIRAISFLHSPSNSRVFSMHDGSSLFVAS